MAVKDTDQLLTVSKSYPFHVKDKIETALHHWLSANIKSCQIISIKTDELKAIKTILIQFDNPFEARKFEMLKIPVDLYRWRWRGRLRRGGNKS